MARIRNVSILKGAASKRARAVVAKTWMDLVTAKPRKRKRSSDKQEENNQIFKEATQYAKIQMKNPEAKAAYAKGITPKKNAAFRVALSDYLNAPVVHYIKAPGYTGAIGDTISIKATDDFKVTAVHLSIISASGKLLERGDAVQQLRKRHMWKYATTVANPDAPGTKIKVIAYDRPRNEGKGEVVIGADHGTMAKKKIEYPILNIKY